METLEEKLAYVRSLPSHPAIQFLYKDLDVQPLLDAYAESEDCGDAALEAWMLETNQKAETAFSLLEADNEALRGELETLRAASPVTLISCEPNLDYHSGDRPIDGIPTGWQLD